MAHKPLDLGAAIMQPGRQTTYAGNVVAMGETPMVLTLDQLRPNPDNPRTTRNPRYDDIKNSIHARGLDTVLKSPVCRTVSRMCISSVTGETPVTRY